MPYYVDAVNGSDLAAGTSLAHPWKTLDQAIRFTPAGERARLVGSAIYSATVTDMPARGTPAIIEPNSGDSPTVGRVYMSNVEQLRWERLRLGNRIDHLAGVWDIEYRDCVSVRTGAASANTFGIVWIIGPSGGRVHFETNVWQDLVWTPPNPDDDNGPTCIVVSPAYPVPVDITTHKNIFRRLVGFDGVQVTIARKTNSPAAGDFITGLEFDGDVFDSVIPGGTKAHADPIQVGGFVTAPKFKNIWVSGGGRGILLQPNTQKINNVTSYYGRIDDALFENVAVVDTNSFTLVLGGHCPGAIIRHCTLLVDTPDASNLDRGLRLLPTRPGNTQAPTRDVTLVNTIANQLRVVGSASQLANMFRVGGKRNNVVKTTIGYTADATDTTGTEPTFSDRANAIPPRQLSDLVVTGGAARNGATTGSAAGISHTVATDARGFTRSGTRDIGALDADAVESPTPDTEAPSGAMTSPLAGAVYAPGTLITVGAQAMDNFGVAGVQFKRTPAGGGALVNVGSEDTVAPYAVAWDTTALADGVYELSAVVRDTAGNTTSLDPVAVTLETAPPAVDPGRWGAAV